MNAHILYRLVFLLGMQLFSASIFGMEMAVQIQRNQSSPLHMAVERGTIEEVTKLLNRNADVNAKNGTGATPLHAAAVRGNVEMCTVLLEYGADCNGVSNSKNTPLHLAALRGHVSVCEILMQSGADLTLRNGAGQTPLQLAHENNHTGLYALLTGQGAREGLVEPSAPNWNDIPELFSPPVSQGKSSQRSSREYLAKKNAIPDAPEPPAAVASSGLYPALFDPFVPEQTYSSPLLYESAASSERIQQPDNERHQNHLPIPTINELNDEHVANIQWKLIFECKGHTENVTALSVTSDGKKIVSGSKDGTILVWDIASGKQIAICKGHEGDVKSICVSLDSKKIVSSSVDGTVRAWNINSGQQIFKKKVESVGPVIMSLDDEKILTSEVTYSDKLFIATWNTHLLFLESNTGKVLKKFKISSDEASTVCRSTEHLVSISQICISSNGKKIISSHDDGTVKVWDAKASKKLLECRVDSKFICATILTNDDKKIICGSFRTISVWDIITGEQLALCENAEQQILRSLCITPDNNQIISAWVSVTYTTEHRYGTHENRKVRIYDLHSGKLLNEFKITKDEQSGERCDMHICITPDGKKIIVSVDRIIQVYELS